MKHLGNLTDQNGGWFISPGDLNQSNTTYTYTYCVPDTNCYVFTISDTYGEMEFVVDMVMVLIPY